MRQVSRGVYLLLEPRLASSIAASKVMSCTGLARKATAPAASQRETIKTRHADVEDRTARKCAVMMREKFLRRNE